MLHESRRPELTTVHGGGGKKQGISKWGLFVLGVLSLSLSLENCRRVLHFYFYFFALCVYLCVVVDLKIEKKKIAKK